MNVSRLSPTIGSGRKRLEAKKPTYFEGGLCLAARAMEANPRHGRQHSSTNRLALQIFLKSPSRSERPKAPLSIFEKSSRSEIPSVTRFSTPTDHTKYGRDVPVAEFPNSNAGGFLETCFQRLPALSEFLCTLTGHSK
jgi:hypothetical protein